MGQMFQISQRSTFVQLGSGIGHIRVESRRFHPKRAVSTAKSVTDKTQRQNGNETSPHDVKMDPEDGQNRSTFHTLRHAVAASRRRCSLPLANPVFTLAPLAFSEGSPQRHVARPTPDRRKNPKLRLGCLKRTQRDRERRERMRRERRVPRSIRTLVRMSCVSLAGQLPSTSYTRALRLTSLSLS